MRYDADGYMIGDDGEMLAKVMQERAQKKQRAARRTRNPELDVLTREAEAYIADLREQRRADSLESREKNRTSTVEALRRFDVKTDEALVLQAYGRVFQRTDRIIGGDYDVSVRVGDVDFGVPEKTAGYTDGLEIVLNEPLIVRQMEAAKTDAEKTEIALSFYGVNLHELAHTIFTPRVGSSFHSRIAAYGEVAFEVANAFEDQRAETRFVGLYPSASIHLRRMALQQIIKQQTEKSEPWMHMLVWGRKFLDDAVRIEARKSFEYETGLAVETSALIDEYLTLSFPDHEDRAVEVVLEMLDLLGDRSPDFPRGNHGDQSEGEPDEAQDAEATEGAERQVAEDEAGDDSDDSDSDDSDGSDEDSDDGEDEGEGEGEDDDDDDSGEGDDEEAGEAIGEPCEDGSDSAAGESDDDAISGDDDDSSSTESAEDGAGDDDGSTQRTDAAGTEHSDGSKTETTQTAAEEALAGLDASDGWGDEIEELDRSVRNEVDRMENGQARGHDVRRWAKPIEATTQTQLRKIERSFDELRAELESAWVERQSTGRLNVERFVQNQIVSPGDFDVFDVYDPGAEDASAVELVILIDVSGSMNGSRVADAADSAWALKMAVDRLGGRTSVLTFGADHGVLYHPTDRVSRGHIDVPYSGGGTNPTQTLIEARRILRLSDMPNKMMVVLTDGAWSVAESVNPDGSRAYWAKDGVVTINGEVVIEAMNADGVVTAIFGLGNAVSSFGHHSCQFGHDLRNPRDLSTAVDRLVVETARRTALRLA